MERKYLLIGHFTSICSTTCNNYSLLKCNRDYLILNVIIFSKKGVMIIKKNLIEAGKYMNIRGKKLYVETHGNPKNKPVLYLHGGPGESCYDFSFHQSERLKDSLYVIMIDRKRCLSLRRNY